MAQPAAASNRLTVNHNIGCHPRKADVRLMWRHPHSTAAPPLRWPGSEHLTAMEVSAANTWLTVSGDGPEVAYIVTGSSNPSPMDPAGATTATTPSVFRVSATISRGW